MYAQRQKTANRNFLVGKWLKQCLQKSGFALPYLAGNDHDSRFHTMRYLR